LWFDLGLAGLFITSTLLYLGEDINSSVVSSFLWVCQLSLGLLRATYFVYVGKILFLVFILFYFFFSLLGYFFIALLHKICSSVLGVYNHLFVSKFFWVLPLNCLVPKQSKFYLVPHFLPFELLIPLPIYYFHFSYFLYFDFFKGQHNID
jgi:hypothetical protein